MLGNLTMDPSGNLYITGGCAYAVPCLQTTPGAFLTAPGPGIIFAMKLTAGRSVVYSTFLPGGFAGIAADADGNLTVVGSFGASKLPVTPNAFQTSPVFANPQAGYGGFVEKLDSTGSKLIYATYFTGTSGQDNVTGVFIDTRGNAIFEGYAYSPDLPVTSNAWLPCHPAPNFAYANGPEANYISRLSADGESLLYSSFIGTLPNGMVGDGLRFAGLDAENDLYLWVANVIVRYHITQRPKGSAACAANASHGYQSALAPLELVLIRGNDVAGGRSMGTTITGGGHAG